VEQVRWLDGVVISPSDLRLSLAGLNLCHDTAWLFLRKVTVSVGQLSWDKSASPRSAQTYVASCLLD